MKKNMNIVKVVIYTWAQVFEAQIYYVSGKIRTIEFNDISELPKTVQNVIIGNNNTVVAENKTVFFSDIATETTIRREIALTSEFAKSISLRGEQLNEWNILMFYLMIYQSAHFRIVKSDDSLKVLVNPFGSTFGSNFESTSKYSILRNAVNKYETNSILANRIEVI
ncbi:MAG: hypothetical protein MJ007_05230 [Paludibacteraceae bacterium]|nr:hypothetical protein [Paludibacteraceae bacterium]